MMPIDQPQSTKANATRIVLFVIAIVAVANLAISGVLLVQNRQPVAGRKLGDSQMAQAAKLFNIVTDFQRELENVIGQASYETDEEKTTQRKHLRDHTLAFALNRVEYDRLASTRSVDDLT